MNQAVETMRTLSDLPGPKGLPLLGKLLQLNFKQSIVSSSGGVMSSALFIGFRWALDRSSLLPIPN